MEAIATRPIVERPATIVPDFNEEKHEYTVAGEVIPSVTQILQPLHDFSMVDPVILKRAMELGSMVHKTTELFDLGTLDEDDLDPILQPYLDGWKAFRTEVDFEPVTIEERAYHPTFKFCGTSDRTGRVRQGRRMDMAVLDIKKMMSLGPVIGPQLAAYQSMHNLNKTREPIVKRYALGLRPDGTYRLKEYNDQSDLACFMSLLAKRRADETITKWKAKNGHK